MLVTSIDEKHKDLLEFCLKTYEYKVDDLSSSFIIQLLEVPEEILEVVLKHLKFTKVDLVKAYIEKEDNGKNLLHELVQMMRYDTVKKIH